MYVNKQDRVRVYVDVLKTPDGSEEEVHLQYDARAIERPEEEADDYDA